MAILASALVTLPAALSADLAVNGWVNTADRGPLDTPSPSGSSTPAGTLGATGASPHDTQLSPQLVHDAANPSALATGAGAQANVPSGPLGIPGVVLDAYMHAQQVLATQEPNCHLPWWLLAGIGQEESGQAENGDVDSNGTTLYPILGPVLNGTNGNAALPAILGGRWTGDTVWQRAVGPMQFLPSTWLEWGGTGNPNNVYDAAIAAGKYLCAGGRDLSDPAQQAAAVFSYNHSDSYVQIVLLWANAYRNGVTPLPETLSMPQQPQPTGGVPTPPAPTGPANTGSTNTQTSTTSSSSAPSSTTTTTTTGSSSTTTTTTTTTAPTTTTTSPTCTTTTDPTTTTTSTTPTGTTTPPPPTTTASTDPTTTPPTTTTTTPTCP